LTGAEPDVGNPVPASAAKAARETEEIFGGSQDRSKFGTSRCRLETSAMTGDVENGQRLIWQR
jgi:hypothetical protein